VIILRPLSVIGLNDKSSLKKGRFLAIMSANNGAQLEGNSSDERSRNSSLHFFSIFSKK